LLFQNRQNSTRITARMWEFAVPTSEKEPRVPNPRPNWDGLLTVQVELGLLKLGCFLGKKLFASKRSCTRVRSLMRHHLASESWVQFRPGPSNVLRPRLPGVKAAG